LTDKQIHFNIIFTVFIIFTLLPETRCTFSISIMYDKLQNGLHCADIIYIQAYMPIRLKY